MRPRRLTFRVGLPDPEQDATIDFPAVRLGAKAATTRRAGVSAGMGRKNFLAEILDNYAALNKERKQELIDCARRLVREQREAG